jgi:hypothetical protein
VVDFVYNGENLDRTACCRSREYQSLGNSTGAFCVYMGKSQVIDKIERDGRTIAIYDNGMERDVEANKIIRPPTAALITKDNAREIRAMRQEKAARLLRERIRAATEKISDLPIGSSAAAVAEAGGILWDEIVLNTEAYPRDRMEAWLKLGQMAGVIPNVQERGQQEKTDTERAAGDLAAVARELRRLIVGPADPADVIDADSTDIRNDEQAP